MGRAYSDAQKVRVRALLESGCDEDVIEKDTGVSDRTIRRWKLDLERTGRIGKPRESRTGRHRVLSSEIEAVLFEHVKENPGMSVDDMLWWLHEKHNLVVGTRTIRRAFERRGNRLKPGATDTSEQHEVMPSTNQDPAETMAESTTLPPDGPYYTPTVMQDAEGKIPEALATQQSSGMTTQSYAAAAVAVTAMADQVDANMPEDEELIQLQLQQIALQKQELELKLKMRRLQQEKAGRNSRTGVAPLHESSHDPSPLYNPILAAASTPPKRDSRSKKKIAETKQRTAERQDRMLRDLERRSRRRERFTVDWVTSKDIWPLRAQNLLAQLMHRYSCYSFNQSTADIFGVMFRELYQLVDLENGDWIPAVHDALLLDRIKRKMNQLRLKMQRTGEITGRTGSTYEEWQQADDYTGEQAGTIVADESEMNDHLIAHHDHLTSQDVPEASLGQEDAQMAYDSMPDHQQHQRGHQDQQQHHHHHHSEMTSSDLPYGALLMAHQSSHSHTTSQAQYPVMPQQHHTAMLSYGSSENNQQSLSHEDGLVM